MWSLCIDGCYRPFARSGHMVPKITMLVSKLRSENSKTKQVEVDWYYLHCFGSPTVQLAHQHVWFCTMWPDRARGLSYMSKTDLLEEGAIMSPTSTIQAWKTYFYWWKPQHGDQFCLKLLHKCIEPVKRAGEGGNMNHSEAKKGFLMYNAGCKHWVVISHWKKVWQTSFKFRWCTLERS